MNRGNDGRGASFDDVAMGKESVSKGLEETPDRYIIDTGVSMPTSVNSIYQVDKRRATRRQL
jgi:hypothetical protein